VMNSWHTYRSLQPGHLIERAFLGPAHREAMFQDKRTSRRPWSAEKSLREEDAQGSSTGTERKDDTYWVVSDSDSRNSYSGAGCEAMSAGIICSLASIAWREQDSHQNILCLAASDCSLRRGVVRVCFWCGFSLCTGPLSHEPLVEAKRHAAGRRYPVVADVFYMPAPTAIGKNHWPWSQSCGIPVLACSENDVEACPQTLESIALG